MILAIKNAFRRLTTSQTIKLLFLEFLVVLAGVLAAQLLQQWLEDRAERNRAQVQVAGIATSLHNSAELAVIRQRMSVCMLDQIERLNEALSQPGIDQSELGWVRVPEQNIMDNPGIDAARPLITKVYGADMMMRFSLIEFAFDKLYEGQDRELAAWERLSVLNPASGPVSEDARLELQFALAEARQANRLMTEVSGIMRAQSEGLQAPVHENTIEAFAKSPKLCADMVGYSDEEHREALQNGELPDGTKLHPRAMERLQIGIF